MGLRTTLRSTVTSKHPARPRKKLWASCLNGYYFLSFLVLVRLQRRRMVAFQANLVSSILSLAWLEREPQGLSSGVPASLPFVAGIKIK